jgi:hypothetical protein
VTVTHPLSRAEAAAIRDRLHDGGIDVTVTVDGPTAHLWPQRPMSTYDEVTALAAFLAATDGVAWHGRTTP